MHYIMKTHLPHGFNTLFEQVEVTVACQVAWPDHVTIETPELFHLEKDEKSLCQQLWENELTCLSQSCVMPEC